MNPFTICVSIHFYPIVAAYSKTGVLKIADLSCSAASPTVSVIRVKSVDCPVEVSVPPAATVEYVERKAYIDFTLSSKAVTFLTELASCNAESHGRYSSGVEHLTAESQVANCSLITLCICSLIL